MNAFCLYLILHLEARGLVTTGQKLGLINVLLVLLLGAVLLA